MEGIELKRTLDVHRRIARVMADDRFPVTGPNTRMLAVAVIWVLGAERVAPGDRWSRINEILNLRNYSLGQIVAADAPRWEPPAWDHDGRCEAPMIRRDGPCGQRAAQYVTARVTDRSDGTWRIARFCRRHEDHARQADRADRLMVQAGGIPEPVPNTGGLLPCYLTWSWPEKYASARPGWKPPSYGICADDWPVMATVTAMEPPKLRLLAGDGEGAEHDAPSLRLLRS